MDLANADFNVRRNDKANNSERNHGDKYMYFLNNFAKKIEKKYREPVTVESELERNQKKLDTLKENHEKMKTANRILKKKGLPKPLRLSTKALLTTPR